MSNPPTSPAYTTRTRATSTSTSTSTSKRQFSEDHNEYGDIWAREEFFCNTKDDGRVCTTIVRLFEDVTQFNDEVAQLDLCAMENDFPAFASKWTFDWVDVAQYVERCREWIDCGSESFVSAVCLMQQLESTNSIPPLTQRTFHRVFFTALMISVKTLEDCTLRNVDFAKVGCMTALELARMELAMLKGLRFNATVTSEMFTSCRNELLGNFKRFKRRFFRTLRSSTSPVTAPLTIQTMSQTFHKFAAATAQPAVPPKRSHFTKVFDVLLLRSAKKPNDTTTTETTATVTTQRQSAEQAVENRIEPQQQEDEPKLLKSKSISFFQNFRRSTDPKPSHAMLAATEKQQQQQRHCNTMCKGNYCAIKPNKKLQRSPSQSSFRRDNSFSSARRKSVDVDNPVTRRNSLTGNNVRISNSTNVSPAISESTLVPPPPPPLSARDDQAPLATISSRTTTTVTTECGTERSLKVHCVGSVIVVKGKVAKTQQLRSPNAGLARQNSK